MTSDEIKIAQALAQCSFLPGSPAKRHAHTLARYARENPNMDLTEKSRELLYNYAIRYRRQIPSEVMALIPPERYKLYELKKRQR